MKCESLCVLAAATAVLWAGAAGAQTNADFRTPGAPSVVKAAPPLPAKRAVAAPRPAMFAAASAASVRPLTPEQRDEWRFLKEAAATSRFEGDASRMALAKSNDAGVRALAATLINHHASTGSVLQHMLHVRSMAPPMLANDQRKTLNRLAKLQGVKFDREYMDEIGLRYQQDDVQLYEKASLAVRDPALKGWIDRTLPTLRYQLATAERVMAGNTRLAKAAPSPTHATPPVRHAAVQPSTSSRFVPRGALSTQFMGAGPAQTGAVGAFGGGLGNDMQLGPTRPVAARPIESNTR